MQTIQEIAQDIVAREGGHVNDPDDPGGATNHGVTIHTMRRLGLDLDGDVDQSDVRQISQGQATQIFIDHYFREPLIDRLPAVLQPSVFDIYVNAGSHAVKILQRLFNEMRLSVSVDGVIGPQTIAAAKTASAAAPEHIADAYGIARRDYYYALADSRSVSRKYAKQRDGGKGGWITRAETFLAPRFHLTQTEHSERTAKWGQWLV